MRLIRLGRATTLVTLIAAGSLAVSGPVVASPRAHLSRSARREIGGSMLASHGLVETPESGAPALPTGLTSASWLVADLTTGQVLAAKDPHGEFLPASTLKTLTAATLIPRLDPKSTFKVTDLDADVDGTRAGLVPGYPYTIHKLFQAMLIMSANDAADALAQANGGIKPTLREMNAEARHLQAYDTHADTPSGLDGPGEHTSAYDLALIAQHNFADPAFRHYVETVHTAVPAPHHKSFQIYTHNFLLTTYRGDIGGKNGYTIAADATYVGAATRGGQTILVTLMHANPYFWPEATSLLNWGFAAQDKVEPVGQLVAPLARKKPARVAADSIGPRASGGSAVSANHSHDVDFGLLALSLLVLVAEFTRRRRRSHRPRLRLPRS